MSKINISFDTKDKVIGCSVDDKTLSNVHAVVLYKEYGSESYSMRVSRMTHDKENDMRYEEHIMAKNSAEGYLINEINSVDLGGDLFKQIPFEYVSLEKLFSDTL